MSRFEIKTSYPTDAQKRFLDPSVHDAPHYSVVDTETGKPVPFGGYSKREMAEARVKREEIRNG